MNFLGGGWIQQKKIKKKKKKKKIGGEGQFLVLYGKKGGVVSRTATPKRLKKVLQNIKKKVFWYTGSGHSKSKMTYKLHHRLKSYRDFAEWVDFSYCIGGVASARVCNCSLRNGLVNRSGVAGAVLQTSL